MNPIRTLLVVPLACSLQPAASSQTVQFDPPLVLQTGDFPTQVQIADLNLDGRPDLVVANSFGGSLTIYLAVGTGFAATTVPVAADASSVAVADLDGDCFPDAAVGTGAAGVAILLNDGAGALGAATFHPSGGVVDAIARTVDIGDFDADGAPDVVVANVGPSNFSFLRGDGQGGFAQAVDFDTALFPYDIATGDFDEDGARDIVCANGNSYEVNVHLGDGQGGFVWWQSYSSGDWPTSVTVDDVNGDGHSDIVATNDLAGGTYVYLGHGNGSFTSTTPLPVAGSSRTADFDLDGDVDVVLSGPRVYSNDGNAFPLVATLPPGSVYWGLAAGDLNGDGTPDIVGPTTGFDELRIYYNRSVPWALSPVNGHWYHRSARARWLDGELTAVRYGGHLATVRSVAENDWLRGFLAGDAGYVGLTDVYAEGSFFWTSGEPVTFTNWAAGQPDDLGNADFCVLDPSGEWRDEPATLELPGVVEVISGDCDQDGFPDVFEIAVGWESDVDGNGLPDACLSPVFCTSNPNSTSQAATLAVSGSTVVWENGISFLSSSVPANRFGYYLTSEVASFVPLFGGSQGNLCLGLPIVRFSGDILFSGPSGTLDFTPDLTALPQGTNFDPGETWLFQAWFRDQNPGPTSNTTDAVAVTFTTSAGPLLRFTHDRSSADEGAGSVVIRIVLSQPTTEDVVLPFAHGGTATHLVDYRVDTQSPLVIPAGTVCGGIAVTVVQDPAQEPNELVTFTLSAPSGARLGDPRVHALTIRDDD